MLATIPKGRVEWSDTRLRQAWVLLALAAAVALLLFPSTVSIGDEAFYAGQAHALLHGHVVPTAAEAMPMLPGHAAETLRYPPGWPILLVPFRLLGFRAMFAAALAIHLVGGAAVARMLVRRELPAWLAVAYVFHPVAWVFSRTLMSDVPAVALLLVAMDQWEQGRAGRSSFALGWSMFSRVASLVAAAGMGLAVLADRPRRRDLLILAAGPVVAAVAVAELNLWTQGNPLGAWYGGQGGMDVFDGAQIPLQLALYAAGLTLIPPFPLACLILRPRECSRWALAAIPPLLFFVYYSYHDASVSRLETFFGGQRLVLAVHVTLIVSTMRVWAAIPLLRFRTATVGLAATAAAAAAFMFRQKLEDRFTPAIAVVRACRPERVAFNDLALRVAAAVEAREYQMILPDVAPPPADVGVLAVREVSRNARAEGYFPLPAAWAATRRCTRAGMFMVFDLSGRCHLPDAPCELPLVLRQP